MRKPAILGDLGRGRTFWYGARKMRVARNLGAAGVSVRSAATETVTVGGRTFEAADRRTEMWSAGSPVEVEWK